MARTQFSKGRTPWDRRGEIYICLRGALLPAAVGRGQLQKGDGPEGADRATAASDPTLRRNENEYPSPPLASERSFL